jgi:orotidine-5'-phosphate decarboxylase
VCAHIRAHHPDVVLILDAKRGDIGSTAEHYAREAFVRYGAHAVTVNPYLGTDSVEPFLAHGGGVIGLCRTSNRGGADVQGLMTEDGPVYRRVAQMIAERWAQLGDCGLVVGATYPDELAAVRAIVGDLPILVPGIGAQGGDPVAVRANGCTPRGTGVIVSSSRAVLYAGADEDFAERAADVAERTAAQLQVTPTAQ